ncbi:MAG: prolipoprotein diacylglyceryl transferase family protein [Caldilineaceae bacterium]
MYPNLPFGPLTLPTGPILTFFAMMIGLEISAHYGKRLGLSPDAVWNAGLLAMIAGLIVARLWNVIQFSDIYRAEPLLIFSLRPGGFVLLPGVIAALGVGYLYLLRKALDPLRVVVAFAIGALAAGVLINISAFLTGSLIGTRSAVPWALPYFTEVRHPVALYQALGLILLLSALWLYADVTRLGRTLLLAALGYSLVRLVLDAFVDEAVLWGNFRRGQVLAFAAALVLTLLLASSEPKLEKQQSPPA